MSKYVTLCKGDIYEYKIFLQEYEADGKFKYIYRFMSNSPGLAGFVNIHNIDLSVLTEEDLPIGHSRHSMKKNKNGNIHLLSRVAIKDINAHLSEYQQAYSVFQKYVILL